MRLVIIFAVFASVFFQSSCSSITTEAEIVKPISSKPAVIDLLDSAQNHSVYGEYAQAKAKLERALRLDSQNPYVWFELAKVNREQGKTEKAKNLALRAQSFSEDKRLLKLISRFINDLSY